MNYKRHMDTTIIIKTLASIVLFVLAAVSVPTLFARADARTTLRVVTRPDAPIVVAPTPPFVQPPAPQPPASGITSTTDGSVETGGNQGGNVTTGDQYIDVHEVNIGPVNTPPPQTSNTGDQSSSPAPAPTCLSDRRSSDPCPATPSRTR